MPDRDRVPRREPVAPVVVRQAELAEAGDGLDARIALGGAPACAARRNRRSRRRIETAWLGGSFGDADLAVAAAVGGVDQVIQTPTKAR